jgi:hypothetical protein
MQVQPRECLGPHARGRTTKLGHRREQPLRCSPVAVRVGVTQGQYLPDAQKSSPDWEDEAPAALVPDRPDLAP